MMLHYEISLHRDYVCKLMVMYNDFKKTWLELGCDERWLPTFENYLSQIITSSVDNKSVIKEVVNE